MQNEKQKLQKRREYWTLDLESLLLQAVMRGPLRGIIRQHHLATSDHTKRLSSVEANAKFSSLDTNASTPWMVTMSAYVLVCRHAAFL